VLVEELSRRHPGIVFDLLAAESALTYRALEERKVDLVIARIFRPIPEEHMHAEVLYDEQDVVAAGAQNPWVRRRKVALADLMNEAWTLPPPDSLNGELIVEAFRARGLDLPRATLITASVPVRNALLASGRFLSIVPGSVFRFPASKPGLKRLPIDLPTTRTPVAVITLKNRTLSPVAQVFIDCARKLVKPADQRAMT
jgi:DNA-binding transcriptional LysR family regulator